jgi:hypothetical protein
MLLSVEGMPARSAPQATFTGYLVLASFGLGLLCALSRPLIGIVPESGYLKHLPLVAFVLAMCLHSIGLAVRRDGAVYTQGLRRALWPLLLLGVFAVAGSLYARIEYHQEDTFLTLGLYLLFMPAFFLWGRDEANGSTVVRPLMRVWLWIAVAAIVGSVVQLENEKPLHESEFLVLPVFLYWNLVSADARMRWTAILALIVGSVLTGKITGYVIGLTGVLYVFGLSVWHTPSVKWRGVIYLLGGIGSISVIAAAVFAYFHFRQYMPSGNTQVRLHQYGVVYREFLDSPYWGAAYAGPSGVTFVEGGNMMIIPTHSDVLDLLREGGCIGFALWLTGMIRAIGLLARRKTQTRDAKAFLRTMVFWVLSTVFSYSFNPLLLKPPQAFVIWGLLAVGLSVATDRRPGQLNAA